MRRLFLMPQDDGRRKRVREVSLRPSVDYMRCTARPGADKENDASVPALARTREYRRMPLSSLTNTIDIGMHSVAPTLLSYSDSQGSISGSAFMDELQPLPIQELIPTGMSSMHALRSVDFHMTSSFNDEELDALFACSAFQQNLGTSYLELCREAGVVASSSPVSTINAASASTSASAIVDTPPAANRRKRRRRAAQQSLTEVNANLYPYNWKVAKMLPVERVRRADKNDDISQKDKVEEEMRMGVIDRWRPNDGIYTWGVLFDNDDVLFFELEELVDLIIASNRFGLDVSRSSYSP